MIANPHTVLLEFADVNAMATTPIQNLSSPTNVSALVQNQNPNQPMLMAPRAPAPAPSPSTNGQLPPVKSKSGVIAFVQEEYENDRPPYFLLDPQNLFPISVNDPADPAYPYGDPTAPGPVPTTVIAAQSSLAYSPLPGEPNSNPVHSPNLPGRWLRLNVGIATPPR